MTAKQITLSDQAREKIIRGAGKLADAVRVTLGPKPKCMLIEKEWGKPLVCEDGVTIKSETPMKTRRSSQKAIVIAEVTLRGLLLEQLGRLYDGEKHLERELPRLIELVESPVLMSNLRDWLCDIREQSILLQEIAKGIGAPRLEGASWAIRGLVKHELSILQGMRKGSESDRTIAAHAARHLEHQLSGYEAAASFTAELGKEKYAADLRNVLISKTKRLRTMRELKGNGDFHYESFPVSMVKSEIESGRCA